MESASVPQTDDSKPDEPRGVQPADGELARAYERIKSAGEELTRLDQLVSGLERGSDSPPAQAESPSAESSEAPTSAAPAPEQSGPEHKARDPGPGHNRFAPRVVIGLLLALGIFGAAFASRYGSEARAIMTRWTQPASTEPEKASELREPSKPLLVQVADAARQPSPPAPPAQKAPDVAPPGGAAASAEAASTDVAQSLKTIAHDLAGINDKLEQLKSSHEQTLREHADSIQQLKAAQEQNAKDNARIAEQLQALQAQLATLSAKPAAPAVKKESNAAARQHVPIAEPRRLRRPRPPWMPPPDMVDPWDDPYW